MKMLDYIEKIIFNAHPQVNVGELKYL